MGEDKRVLRALADAAVELASRHERDAVLDRILAELERLVPYDMATVLVLDDDALEVVAARGLRRDVRAAPLRFRAGENARLDRALASRGTVRFTDPDEPDPFDGLAPFHLGRLHSCMAAPMRRDGHVLGLISVDAHEPERFAAEHEELIELFAALAAVAIQNADLVSALERARAQLQGEVASLAEEIKEVAGGTELVGRSAAARQLRDEIALVGPADTTVLILGETGTGKELVARALHAASSRRQRPLIRFDCAGVAPALVESELYGHVKGAFTGATASRAGRFEVAEGSTLFIDEIGELPLELQPRLLRALQEHEIERLGEQKVRRFDVRVLAATNRDLAAEVRAGRFRADLFHRLAIYPLRVPRLEERLDDIPDLVRHFTRKLAPRLKVKRVDIDDAFLRALERSPWPGNVRELENSVERALLRARARDGDNVRLDEKVARGLGIEGRARARDAASFSGAASLLAKGAGLKEATDAFQLSAIEAALAEAGGNLAEAARALGEDRSNLHRRLARLRGGAGHRRRRITARA